MNFTKVLNPSIETHKGFLKLATPQPHKSEVL